MFVGLQALSALLLGAEILIVQSVLKGFLQLHGPASLTSLLPAVALLVLALGIASAATAVISSRRELISTRVARHVGDRLLDVTTSAPLEDFDRPDFYDRLARAAEGRGRPFQMMQGMLSLSRGSTTVVAVAIGLFAVQPLLIPLIVIAFVPLGLLTASSSGALYTFFASFMSREREREYIFDLLTGKDAAKEVRTFNTSDFLRARYNELADQSQTELTRIVSRQTVRTVLGAGLAAVLSAGMILLLGWLVAGGRMTLPQAGAALTGLIVLSSSLPQIVAGSAELYECALFLDDYHSFLARPTRTNIPRESRELHRVAPDFAGIRLEKVTFVYPDSGRAAVADVSLQISPGEVVALVGENGSGKTTIAKLISGLYGPSTGRVLWGGQDMADLGRDAVSNQITAIFQDYVHYLLPAWQNIALGRPESSNQRGQIEQAARLAGADDLIRSLPDGYETVLGSLFPGGVDLSEGQWQRIALARAFFRDAPLIVLDEPTASLDARAEHDLFSRIRELAQGRSLLLISHRFSSVRSADRIYVLDGGRITEQGSHWELMALGGAYAELYGLQVASLMERPAAG